MATFRERAFLACQDQAGKLHAGPQITGSRGKVPFPTVCPAKTKPVAVVHTHPPDDGLEPSDQDLAETRRRGIDLVCVAYKDRFRCFPVH
ncbi:MAG: hypothetical protein IIA92_13780 [Chloroflexi bacterium]|nr:hypothetical protein [Chloroflexota bacterium]